MDWHEWFRKEVRKLLVEVETLLEPTGKRLDEKPIEPLQPAQSLDRARFRYRYPKAVVIEKEEKGDLVEHIERLEAKVDALYDRTQEVHRHTSLLVDRIPEDMKTLMTEVKELLLSRLKAGMSQAELIPSTSPQTPSYSQPKTSEEFQRALELLTPRERHLIMELLEHGFLTYRELAKEMGLSPTTVKNKINLMLQNPLKASLITKNKTIRGNEVGISEEVRDLILKGKKGLR